MYLQNKYTRWYYNIIQRAQTRAITGYKEQHHIIPRSLGGSNSKDNLVALTAREHFICHLCLTKMLSGENKAKMIYAVWQLANQSNQNQNRGKINSTTYQRLRENFSNIHSEWMTNNQQIFKEKQEKYWTEEKRNLHASKISAIVKGRKHSELTIQKFKNKIWTEKAIQNRLDNCLKNAAVRKGVKNLEHGQKIFANYVNANKEVILKIWELSDLGFNRRQISMQLGISWDRANVAINKRAQIMPLLHDQKIIRTI